MTPDDLDTHLTALGLTVETIADGGWPDLHRRPRTSPFRPDRLAGRVCDIAILRPAGVPYTVPAAIHTRPVLVPMGERTTQASPLGAEWQYWSRRFDRPPSPRAVWTHVLTVLGEH